MLHKTYTFFALIALILIVQSCKKVKQEVNTRYETDIHVSQTVLKTDGYLFGGSAILDTSLNKETKNSKIVFVDPGEVRFTIREANLLDMLFAYQMQFKITDNTTNNSITHKLEAINSLFPDNSFLIPNTPENISFFSTIIKEKHTATIEITGYSSQSGVELLFNFKIAAIVGLN